MTSSLRRFVSDRGTVSSRALARVIGIGGCGGGDEDAASRGAPGAASPATQAHAQAQGAIPSASEERVAQAAATDVRATPAPTKRRKARSRDWKGVTALVAARGGDVIGTADDQGRVRVMDAANARVRSTLVAHPGASATGLVFSADGRTLISVGRDSLAAVWNVADGRRMLTLHGHEHPVRAVTASADGAWVATGGEETRVMLWNARNGRLARVLYGAADFVNAVAFSPDARLLAAGDAAGRLHLWDVATGAVRATLLGHAGEVNTLAFSPDGKRLASAGDDGRVLTWNVARGEQDGTLEGHQAPIRSLAFAPDGQTLASAGEDGVIQVWDTTQARSIKRLTGGAAPINALAFHAKNANLLFAGTDSGQVVVWNVARGTPN